MLGGFVLALVMAFPFAWGMASKHTLRSILQPAFVIVQCIPMFTLAPLMVLWFGWSYIAIIVPTALMIFFPLTITIYQGLCSTPKHLVEFFDLNKATPWQTVTKLQMPWALPYIFAGFRIAVAAAGIGAVAGEWAGGQNGLGLLMLESRRAADLEMMFGALVCLAAMSLILYGIAALMETIVCKRLRCHLSKATLQVLLIAILVVPLSGCNRQQDLREEKVVLLLDWLPNPNHVPLYVGVEKGFFREKGVNLSLLKVADPSDSIPFLTSGQVDLILSYMPHAIQAQLHGADIVPIGVLIDQPLNAIIYRTDSHIDTIDDLQGKIIGYTVDGTNNELLRSIFLHKNIAPSDWRNVSFDSIGTLATRQVDAIYGSYWNIEGEHLRYFGVNTSYFPLTAFDVPTYYELVVLARTDSLEDSADFVEEFDNGLQASIDYCIDNPNEAFEIYLKANPDKSLRTQQWERQAWIKTVPLLAREQKIDPKVWNTFKDWLQQRI
jgi:NitT/TauT family transport system substrate-binding protein